MGLSTEEIKLQCIRVSCEVLGVYADVEEKPSVDEIIKKAEQIYSWIISG